GQLDAGHPVLQQRGPVRRRFEPLVAAWPDPRCHAVHDVRVLDGRPWRRAGRIRSRQQLPGASPRRERQPARELPEPHAPCDRAERWRRPGRSRPAGQRRQPSARAVSAAMSKHRNLRREPTMQLKAAFGSLLATLVALPAAATLPIPDDPLTTGSRVAPNILFILDDSGSMAFDYMPDSIPSTSTPNVARYAYTRNTLSYNPATTYRPWVQANGLRMTGGTSYTAAYGSFNRVGGGTIDLGDASSCRRFNYNTNASTDELGSGGTQVCGGRQTFYVPKDTSQTGAAYLGNGTNYYRYDILEGGTDIVRSVWGRVVESSNGVAVSPDSGSVRGNDTNNHNLATVPANGRLTVNIR